MSKKKKKDGLPTRRRLLPWCCFNKEGDGSLLPLLSFLVVLRFNLIVFGCL